jgi:EmrB/QacA subfamily drug resistance transporter
VINPRSRPCEDAVIRTTRGAADCAARAKPWVLAATVLASTMAYIDESVVNVALPAIETDLAAPVAAVQWVINAYTLCLAALVLIGGAAGDLFGRRRVFIAGIAVFAAASLWCGLSTTAIQLILGRAVQGIGAAMLIPCGLAIIGATFAEQERGRAIGTWAGFSAVAAAVGPILGGAMVDQASWRWIFLINPVLALPTIAITLWHVPDSRNADAAAGLDARGAALAFAGLSSLVYGLIALPERGGGAPAVGALIGGLLILLLFVREERMSRAPMVPSDLFTTRAFIGVNLLTLFLYTALSGAFFILPFELIQLHGYSAMQAGAAFLPFTLIMGGLSRWSGGLLDRFGARLPLTAGPAISAAGIALMALPGDGRYLTTFIIPITLLGIGMTISVAPLTTTVINAVPQRLTGAASGFNDAVASVASLLAVALLGAMALATFNHALDNRLADPALTATDRRIIAAAHGSFAIGPALAAARNENAPAARAAISDGFAASTRIVMLLAAGLALAAAVCGAATMPGRGRSEPARPRTQAGTVRS